MIAWRLDRFQRPAVPAPRFYCPFHLTGLVQTELAPRAAHHAAKVLRLAPGDLLTLFDGRGGEHEASVHSIVRDRVMVDVGRHLEVERESPLPVTLAQGLASGDRMDFVWQKAVELGAVRLQPLATRRSVVRLSAERGERRARHWENVVIAACEQCGRNRLPELAPVRELADWLAERFGPALCLLLAPDGLMRLADLPRPEGEVVVLAGPEGGFTADEARLALEAGFIAVRLGPRVLRTETAGLAALAALQALWGDG